MKLAPGLYEDGYDDRRAETCTSRRLSYLERKGKRKRTLLLGGERSPRHRRSGWMMESDGAEPRVCFLNIALVSRIISMIVQAQLPARSPGVSCFFPGLISD